MTYVVCVVSSLPQLFAYQLVDSVDTATNSTSSVSRLDQQLIASFHYAVVYHWYVVCLTVLLPVPLLILIAGVLVASLLRKSRARRKRAPVKPRDSVQGPSSLRHRSSSASNDRSMDCLRLHVALIVLYLLFTCPRSAVTCLQGVFATSSSRYSTTPVTAAETLSSSDVVLALLEKGCYDARYNIDNTH